MNPFKLFRNLNLNLKLNISLVFALVILLLTILLILVSRIRILTIETGRKRAKQEITTNQNRFVEAKQELLLATKLLAASPRLVSALESEDVLSIRLELLTNVATLDLDGVELINAEGLRVTPLTEKGITAVSETTADLLDILGSETTAIIAAETNKGQTFLLVATVPLRDASGVIIGALMTSRKIDDEFLTKINLGRSQVHLGIIYQAQIVALNHSEEGDTVKDVWYYQYDPTSEDLRLAGVPLDQTSIEQALKGETVIDDYDSDGLPHTLAYTPLMSDTADQAVVVTVVALKDLFSFQRQLTTNLTISLMLLTLVTVVIVASLVSIYITSPIHKLKSVAEQIMHGNYQQRAEVETTDEIGQLAGVFNQMTAVLSQAIEANQQAREEAEIVNHAMEIQIWKTRGQAQLNDKMQGEQDIPTLANSIIQQLCDYLQAQIGLLYVLDRVSLTLNQMGSYAYSSKNSPNHFKFGEGLVGQTALQKKAMIITDVPQDYLTIKSGLGEIVPQNIMIFPFIYRNQVRGVLELGTLSKFTQTQMDFIQIALDNIAIAFNTAQARAQIDELLTQTQELAEELHVQGEELRVSNEELEAQTASLRTSESKLKEQQSELEAINAQLEEKAEALEESSLVLREKQTALDLQNRELKIAQQDLKQQAEELALASKYKSEFLANMSHELRTPLNSLLILTQMLVDNEEGNLSEDQIESAQIIYSGGNDLLDIINDILDLSKVESGKMTFNIEPILLRNLLDIIQSQFTRVATEKGLDFNVTLANNLPPTIETDPQRVKQIIKNMLSNAFKFTSTGSVNLHIYRPESNLDLSRSGLDPTQAIAISVTDTGIGMTPEQQKIIFEAFQQADGTTNRQYGGTGLGLSISRELATKLGGQINLGSEAGQGSTFTLYLPEVGRIEDETAAKQSIPPPVTGVGKQKGILPLPPSPPPPQLPHSSASITPTLPDDRADLETDDKILLIIEDDPKFAKIVYTFCHQNGFKGLIAGSGKTGLALVRDYTPHAIILDLSLPDISGWDVLAALKNNPDTRHIPVHIISAHEEILDAYKKGAMGYLTKPVNPKSLTASFQKIEQIVSSQIKTLLLVEDNANSRHSIKKLLDGSDVHISEVERGQAALELLKTQHFDCMILDLSLPDMTGFEVLNKLNEHEVISKCPIIVYTGQDLTPAENLELMKYTDSIIVKGVKSPERLLDETALFLHRVVADMPKENQQTIKQLYNEAGLLKDKIILVVDDDVRNSFALSKLLSDKGIIVKIAQDGQKALDILAQEPIDLVLIDIMMPVMDGYETTRRIRAQSKFNHLPVLALTAKAMKDDRQKCLEAGANDYLPKPIDVERLFSMLRVWLYQ